MSLLHRALCLLCTCSLCLAGPYPSAAATVRLNNGVLMPTLALGTGGYDNQTGDNTLCTLQLRMQ